MPVTAASQGILFSLLDPSAGPLRLELAADPHRGGLIAYHGKTKLGRLPQTMLTAYPQLAHLFTSGFRPTVAVDVHPEEGSGKLHAELLMPAPGLVMPANDPPEKPWALLAEGPRRRLDMNVGEGLGELARVVPAQFLATLTELDGAVVVSVGDHVLGALEDSDAADVRDLVSHFDALGLTPVSRLFVWDDAPDTASTANPTETYDASGSAGTAEAGGTSGTAGTTDVQGSGSAQPGFTHLVAAVAIKAAADATDADLEPVIAPLPKVEGYREKTGSFPVVGPEAKEWTLTVSGALVTDELPAMTEEKLRAIESPAAPGPSGPSAPAEEPGNSAAPETAGPGTSRAPESAPDRRPQPETHPDVTADDDAGGASTMMHAWPGILSIVAGLALISTLAAGIANPVKYALAGLGAVLTIVGVIRLVVRARRKSRDRLR
ncbi:hypothetical protein CATYP_00770 [Corynebacterium atypicum]|uniref:Uncharacterized protein n=1 Tax=Corynebacterium atypicum TaxID=191610 RepID=A0ABN4DBI1_9CORY|nr:hypothetical protein CATYP_00770 [Corynebacterium atypicum]